MYEKKRILENLCNICIDMSRMKGGIISVMQSHRVTQVFENLILTLFTIVVYSLKLLFFFNQPTKQFRELHIP